MSTGSAQLRRWRWRLGLALTAAVTVAGLTASSAPAATPPPPPSGAPTILTGPSGPTSSTTASFTYRHSQPGVTFQCSLDGGTFRSCATGGVTYTDLSSGTHTVRVAARSGSSALSPAATRTWTVDRAAPTVAVTSPADEATLDAAAWAATCAGSPGVCGTATDPAGVTIVRVAVQRTATGRWWDGTSFAASSAQYLTATGTASWRLPLALPADGRYQVLVRATDTVGNQTSGSGVRSRFTVDTSVLTAPVITAKPDDVTEATEATFRFRAGTLTPLGSSSTGSDEDEDDDESDDDGDDTFECSLDGSTFRTCESPRRYRNLGLGNHCFEVRQRNEAGRVSEPARWCWAVIVDQGFPIAGDIADPFLPGLSRTVDVAVTNPYPFALRILEVVVSVRPTTTNAGCVGTTNLVPTRQLAVELVVPANSTRTLSQLGVPVASWPELTMPNLATNQDACRLARFTLSYTGKATKA